MGDETYLAKDHYPSTTNILTKAEKVALSLGINIMRLIITLEGITWGSSRNRKWNCKSEIVYLTDTYPSDQVKLTQPPGILPGPAGYVELVSWATCAFRVLCLLCCHDHHILGHLSTRCPGALQFHFSQDPANDIVCSGTMLTPLVFSLTTPVFLPHIMTK